MLKLLESTITFKGDEARSFLKEKNNGLDLLQEYLEDPATMSEDISRIQFKSLKNPYREVAWILHQNYRSGIYNNHSSVGSLHFILCNSSRSNF
jgi:hypothetical protein